MWQKHRMTAADLMRIHDAQQGLCYLCGDPLPHDRQLLAIDHDHRCCPSGRSCARCRRGLTHHGCNVLIGHAQADPQRLRRIADNLEAAIAAAGERIACEPPVAVTPWQRMPQQRDRLADVLKVFHDDKVMHWQVAADRLSGRFPVRWDGISRGAVRAICGEFGVPSVSVRMGEKVLAGCRRSDVEKALCSEAAAPAA